VVSDHPLLPIPLPTHPAGPARTTWCDPHGDHRGRVDWWRANVMPTADPLADREQHEVAVVITATATRSISFSDKSAINDPAVLFFLGGWGGDRADRAPTTHRTSTKEHNMTENEPIRVTGRHMTGQLQAALDQVGARDRALIAAAFQTQQGRTGPLLRALALELQLAGLREYATIAAAEASVIASDEPERPYPPSPTPGLELWFDPSSGQFTATPPGGGSV